MMIRLIDIRMPQAVVEVEILTHDRIAMPYVIARRTEIVQPFVPRVAIARIVDNDTVDPRADLSERRRGEPRPWEARGRWGIQRRIPRNMEQPILGARTVDPA